MSTGPEWIRAVVRGRGVAVTVSVLCLLTSGLFFLAVAQSSDWILWTGRKVAAHEENGLVYYRYGGVDLTLDVPGTHADRPHVTVYVDPGNPDNVEVDSLGVRMIDGVGVLGPLALAAAAWIVVAGGDRRRRRAPRTGFGSGIPDELLQRIRDNRRRTDS